MSERETNYRYVLRKMYGLTPDTYIEVICSQNYCCAICKQPFDAGRVKRGVVDHLHDGTINYRAVLCISCNFYVGSYENGERLSRPERIEEYLETHPPVRTFV